MAQEKEIIMFDSPDAAQIKMVEMWVSRNGRIYGDYEHGARLDGCTHRLCECGNTYDKNTYCLPCYDKKESEDYYALPVVEWDGSDAVATWRDDKFFFDEESVMDYLRDLKDDAERHGWEPEAQLVLCEPGKLSRVSEDYWCDDLPEDGELPDEVAQKVAELNEAISRAPIVCWWPGKTRIDVDVLWKKLKEEDEADGKV